MKPLDPAETPAHLRGRAGKTGLVHGLAPMLPRSFSRAHPHRLKQTRKGAKARTKMKRILERRFGITDG